MAGKGQRGGHDFGWVSDGHTFISDRASAQPGGAGNIDRAGEGRSAWMAALRRLLKRPQKALAACERLIQGDPDNARAYLRKAELLRELKRDAEALAACERAAELDPNAAEDQIARGTLLERLGHAEEARQAFQHAREIGAQQLERQSAIDQSENQNERR